MTTAILVLEIIVGNRMARAVKDVSAWPYQPEKGAYVDIPELADLLRCDGTRQVIGVTYLADGKRMVSLEDIECRNSYDHIVDVLRADGWDVR